MIHILSETLRAPLRRRAPENESVFDIYIYTALEELSESRFERAKNRDSLGVEANGFSRKSPQNQNLAIETIDNKMLSKIARFEHLVGKRLKVRIDGANGVKRESLYFTSDQVSM